MSAVVNIDNGANSKARQHSWKESETICTQMGSFLPRSDSFSTTCMRDFVAMNLKLDPAQVWTSTCTSSECSIFAIDTKTSVAAFVQNIDKLNGNKKFLTICEAGEEQLYIMFLIALHFHSPQ